MIEELMNAPTGIKMAFLFFSVFPITFVVGTLGLLIHENISRIKQERAVPRPPEGHTSA
ncbi:MAG: hypothetical protein R3251_02470 [Candidatus Spechtbacterales bacterium]|nr:hypothetical protein [Candidatus Spechtbacterales bacterium]